MVKKLPAKQETWVGSLGRKDSPRGGNGNPLQYSCPGNFMDRGAWLTTIHGITRVAGNLVAEHIRTISFHGGGNLSSPE